MDNIKSSMMKEKIFTILNKRVGYIYMNVNNALAEDITDYINQHYYPKEFVRWYINMSNDATEEVYKKWFNNIKK
jgi:hypothetical protein